MERGPGLRRSGLRRSLQMLGAGFADGLRWDVREARSQEQSCRVGPEQGFGLKEANCHHCGWFGQMSWYAWGAAGTFREVGTLYSSTTGCPKGLGTPQPSSPAHFSFWKIDPALSGCPPVIGPSSGVQEETLGHP